MQVTTRLIDTGVNIEDERNTSEASRRWNRIADDMWRQYQEVLQQKSQAGLDEDSESDGELEGNEGNASDESDNDFYVWQQLEIYRPATVTVTYKKKKEKILLWSIMFQHSSKKHITRLTRN